MLTEKQLELLSFIDKRLRRDGVPPSFDEMKDELRLRSKSGIHRLITALEERGFIRRLPHRARAIEVLRLPEALGKGGFTPRVVEGGRADPPPSAMAVRVDAVEIDVMGRIAAGVPIAAISEVAGSVAVPGSMIGSGRHYALEVKGDSMIEAGINDGDVVIIREGDTADDGDIVVALVKDEEATLKRLRRSQGRVALEAANPAYETRFFPASDVKVQGKLVGLIRTY